MRHRLLLMSLLVPLACTEPTASGESETASESGTGESGEETGGEPAYEIELRELACPFEIPPDRSAECYTLVAPLDRTAPEVGVVELPVAVLHPAAAPVRPPVVYFHGGPGGSAFEYAGGWFGRPISEDGDFIVFDQRGGGQALPSLDCVEMGAAWLDAFAATGTPAEEIAIASAAYEQCHTRLSAEVDLSLFNSESNADDVDDLRRALGYDTWNIYGISYGTRLGLAYMRQHGEHVQVAVLDSVYPPQVGGVQWMVDAMEGALDRLVAGCLEEPLCGQTFPNLAADLDTAVALLDAQPYTVNVMDDQGQMHELHLTGADFYAGMFNALYDINLIPVVPLLIFQAAQGNLNFLVDLANQSLPVLTGLSEGARLSIDCADGALLLDPSEIPGTIDQYPRLTTMFGAYALAFCEQWDVAPTSDSFHEPVVSDVPTLLLAGEFDPVTPVSQTQLAGETLSQSELYVFPGYGHGVSRASTCAAEMTREFLRDGGANTSCWSALPDNTF